VPVKADGEKMKFKISTYGILLVVGGILALIGLFLDWTSTATGWSIFSETGSDYKYYLMPVILLLLAVMAIGAGIDEFIGWGPMINKAVRVIAIVVGILIVALSIFLITDFVPFRIGGLGLGFYLTAASGILIAFVSTLSLMKFPKPE
jgi:uncharacterized membrane protein